MTTIVANWDPISRIAGSLGVTAEVDFANMVVAKCNVTSSMFRGFSKFMQGSDPRDVHTIASRICGMCGDNHTICATYAQNMAFGVKPPILGEWLVNLGEAAEFLFDHILVEDTLIGVDFSQSVVSTTTPSVWVKAQSTSAPNSAVHGYQKISDIMLALNPMSTLYVKAIAMSRTMREMFCLMGGRHPHPSTLYPGGVGTVPTQQLFTDYMSRLIIFLDFIKVMVPMYDDLYNFFYDALPGYEKVGYRRTLLACWGTFNNPAVTDHTYANLGTYGKQRYVTPGIIVDGKLVTNDLIQINLGMRILPGANYYTDWVGTGPLMVSQDPLGNPIDPRHPWNHACLPAPQARDLKGKYSWVLSPRWFDGTNYLPLDTGGGALARMWSTALNGIVNTPYANATGTSIQIRLPQSATIGPVSFEWKIPQWSNALERNRARAYFQAYIAALAVYFLEEAQIEFNTGDRTVFNSFTVPSDAVGVGFHEAVRGCLSHHLVIKGGKVASYEPYPPSTWNASPRDMNGVPGPFEDAVQNTPIFETNPQASFKGVDIMRAVRSFDACLACGVH